MKILKGIGALLLILGVMFALFWMVINGMAAMS